MVTYNDSEYANSRLSETVVLRKRDNKLFYVRSVRSLTLVDGYPIDTREDQTLRLSDLDLKPLTLGYTNTTSGAFYVARTPCRRFKQGSNWSNLRLVGCPLRFTRSSYRLLEQPVYNAYPSVNEALALCEDFSNTVGISRSFCIGANGGLYYKGHVKDPVGSVNLDNGAIRLHEQYAYLNDVFDLEVVA